jgi:uncharacterized glyoxalase superfamily protein PhnB
MSASVIYQDASKAIDWLCAAFGFEVRLKVEGDGGKIEHSELVFGDALVMVGEEERQKDKGRLLVSPRSVDAHCERARKAGGTITYEPKVSDYGEDYWADKSYECVDPEGHRWWFAERIRG